MVVLHSDVRVGHNNRQLYLRTETNTIGFATGNFADMPVDCCRRLCWQQSHLLPVYSKGHYPVSAGHWGARNTLYPAVVIYSYLTATASRAACYALSFGFHFKTIH